MLSPCFVNGTLEDAVEALAKLAADCRTRPLSVLEKQALAGSDTLSAVGRFLGTPGGAALAGGGIGAAAGGIGAAWQNRGKPENERRSILSTALTGGLAGAAIGGGGAAALKGYEGLKDPQHAAVKSGPIDIKGTGMKLDPKVMTEMPDAHKRLQELAEPTWPEHITNTLSGGVKSLREFMPFSSVALPLTAAYDFGTHTQQRFGGKMLGDKNILHAPGVAADWVGKKMEGVAPTIASKLRGVGDKLKGADYGIGMIDPRNSTEQSHLQSGLDTVMGEQKKYPQFSGERQQKVLAWLNETPEGRAKFQELARTRKPGDVTHAVTTMEERTGPSHKEVLHEGRMGDDGEPGFIDRYREQMVPGDKTMHPVTGPETLNAESIKHLKAIGAETQLGGAGMKENLAPNSSGVPRVRRGILGNTHNVGKLSSLGRLIPRLALYTGIPAFEFLRNSAVRSQDRTAQREALIEQMRQRGLIAQ